MATPMNNTGSAVGSVDPRDLLDNAQVLDKLLNGDAESVAGRLNKVLKSWAGIVADATRIIESARQNLIPLSRQYMTLAAAQADIASIPVGSTTFVRSPDDTALALEYINDGGTLKPTGRKMPSQESLDIVSAYYQIFEKYFSQNGSGNLYEWYDKEQQNLIAFMDPAGQLFLPGFNSRPVQALQSDIEQVSSAVKQSESENLHEWFDKDKTHLVAFLDAAGQFYLPGLNSRPVQSLQDDIRQVSEAVTRDAPPAILRLTDAQNSLLGFVDEMGEHHIPGLGGESLQRYISKTRKKVDALYQHRQCFNAVTDFGIDNRGLNDCSSRVQAAINYLAGLKYGGAVYFPDGVYRLHNEIVPRDNVTILMAPGRARFLPVGSHGAITRGGGKDSYLKNAQFIDVEIDGSEQAVYGYWVKGFYIQYFTDCLFLRCYTHDIAATGIGIDFPDKSFILDCRTDNCGRLSSLGRAGSSGIGIGTGARQDESLIISRTINRGNKNFGIFFEQQTADPELIYQSRQIIVADSIMTGNGWGFGDCGLSGVILNACQINDNIHEGILIDSGTLTVNNNRPQSGNYGIATNCQIQRNGSHGINYSSTKSLGGGGYSFSGNKVKDNNGNGVHLEAKAEYSLPDMCISGNDLIGNAGDAIEINSGTWTDIDIMNNRAIRNGGNIKITGNIDTGSITGNKLRSKNGAHAIEGAGSVKDIDITENQYTDTSSSPVSLTGTQTNVTYGRNPGF
ncbi:right-handed parallel beta-helix repeat-containing protein [Erwinia sp. S43]|uniref:right-handed parallel beta-helix repeat-containing protein n=1 Tax=Erwinia sp. S43 TaxID=2769339 RepID=UPI00190DE59A|nr:right-handed parallel beta-helix repeat-containing protein [Erwinia sp. S43]MBK0032758.1 right-handed parallel beta-helix repeat-containing protein [Erwinia sp. S43]